MTPALVVFHTPPDPTVKYQILSSSGCTAISEIRPDINAGPILLNCKPVKLSSAQILSFLFCDDKLVNRDMEKMKIKYLFLYIDFIRTPIVIGQHEYSPQYL